MHRCFCMNENVKSGRMEDFIVFKVSLICFVQSLFTSTYGSQGTPLLRASVVSTKSGRVPAPF